MFAPLCVLRAGASLITAIGSVDIVGSSGSYLPDRSKQAICV